jgi:hypothetical protein
MAVYPNRIVQKDTTDVTSTALTAIANGTESVVVGELVVNRYSNEVFLLTKYSNTVAKVVSAPSPLGNRGDITVTADGYTWTVNNGAINDAKFTGPLSIAKGGTGTTTANGALNAFLPSQATNAGKSLLTDGTNSYWGSQLPLTSTLNHLLKWTGSSWTSASFSTFNIDELGDVDTTTKAPVKNQSLTWDGSKWAPGVSATRIGRGDAGDFDIAEVESAFVFGVWGGGDFDTTSQDVPIELLRQDLVDGCEIISDYTAQSVNSNTLSIVANDPTLLLSIAVNIPTSELAITVEQLSYVGSRAYVDVPTIALDISSTGSYVQAGESNYFSDWIIQNFYVQSDFMTDWWAN